MNRKVQNLSNELQKVLGSTNDDFFEEVTVTSKENEDENVTEEVEEITDDEVNEAMDEETPEDEVSEEVEDVDDENADDAGEVETEISIDEGTDVDDSEEDDNSSVVEDDENDDEGDFADADDDASSNDNISEEDIVEVDNIEEVSDDDEHDEVSEVEEPEEISDEDVVEVDDVEEITDDDVDNASEEVEDVIVDEEPEEITDDEIADSADIEEITDEDIENEEADSSANNIVIDTEATASASELLSQHGYKFETDACGKLCVQGCDSADSNVEVVEEIPNDLKVAPSDVNLILHESASEDPFYSVLINGKPVASIHLKDQEGDDKRDFFISSEYPKALTEAMVKGGVNAVLDAQKAKRFVASVKASALAQEMKAQAKAEMESEVKAAVVKMKDKFVECAKLAIAGMNKNFFTNDNDLKGAVYQAFANFGANNEQALHETEKVFANADSFFSSVVNKAEELMGFDENSFKTIASAVSNSGVGNREVETFESKLMKGNNPVVASAFAQPNDEHKVTASAKKLTFKKHIS